MLEKQKIRKVGHEIIKALVTKFHYELKKARSY